ncbi:hypothetical protein EYZ11_004579 [Aspergillus tanneri]|uniref:Erv26 super protein n=1 Tax=Aspergillus tanneri TaxID=1220188 RepID=A0A4S3JMH0_9EURO|nr:hypothetical protein EYZ11_004579 [Aspergillus tanneri]
MWILPLVGYLGVIVGFSFLTLAIASGLYYLSELVEEHTVLARRLLTRLIYSIVFIQILLFLFDRFPLSLSVLSIGSHMVYATNVDDMPTFTEVASYFGLCVWLVPFALFVSLSAGENVLPSMGSEYVTGERISTVGVSSTALLPEGRNKNKGMAKALVDGVRDWVKENGELMGFWREDRSKRF